MQHLERMHAFAVNIHTYVRSAVVVIVCTRVLVSALSQLLDLAYSGPLQSARVQ